LSRYSVGKISAKAFAAAARVPRPRIPEAPLGVKKGTSLKTTLLLAALPVNSLSFLAGGISDKMNQPRTKSMTKEGSQVGANGMDIFEGGAGDDAKKTDVER
jgi:hypothetical protein